MMIEHYAEKNLSKYVFAVFGGCLLSQSLKIGISSSHWSLHDFFGIKPLIIAMLTVRRQD